MRLSAFTIFVSLSLIWGFTWIAIKFGLETTPPLFFAGTRFMTAGLILAVIARRRFVLDDIKAKWKEFLVVALLITTFCYGPIFWGVQFTSSGLAAVINLSLIPIFLFALGVGMGTDKFDWGKGAGLVMGIGGLGILFWPELRDGATFEGAGVGALVFGTFAYCLGSVLSGKWLTSFHPTVLSSIVMGVGGLAIFIWSLLAEPVTLDTFAMFLNPKTLVSWLFLVIFGSAIALTMYLELLRRWGPIRSSLYAFVSPIVALITGAIVLGERLEWIQFAGAILLISAAALVMGRKAFSEPQKQKTPA